jgi:hypothetical protein
MFRSLVETQHTSSFMEHLQAQEALQLISQHMVLGTTTFLSAPLENLSSCPGSRM